MADSRRWQVNRCAACVVLVLVVAASGVAGSSLTRDSNLHHDSQVDNVVSFFMSPERHLKSRTHPNNSAGDNIPDQFKVVLEVRPSDLSLSEVTAILLEIGRQLHQGDNAVHLASIQPRGVLEIYASSPASDQLHETSGLHVLLPANHIISKLNIRELNRRLTNVHVGSVRTKDTEHVSQSPLLEPEISFGDELIHSWKLAVIVASGSALVVLVILILIFICYRNRRTKKNCEAEVGGQRPLTCVLPPIKPIIQTAGILQPEPCLACMDQYFSDDSSTKSELVRLKARGLLERRGSNASLILDLHPSDESLTPSSSSPRLNNIDYLLSAGSRMPRMELRNCLKDIKALHSEFWDIPMNHPERVEIPGSGTKNRYRSILPNEHSRVRLPFTHRDQLSGYINANYIQGYDGEEKAYIATQGPLVHTISDFWLMVWSERAPIVVMITKLREKNKVKCEKYFPERSAVYGDIEVRVISTTVRDGYTVTDLQLRRGSSSQSVQHYWYTAWPDHKAPPSPKQLVVMCVEVEASRCDDVSKSRGPVLVHCSAGIGRTGCFIAISIGMQQILEENAVDILGIVCSMRRDRGGMVQTAEQYEFIHRALSLFERSLPDGAG